MTDLVTRLRALANELTCGFDLRAISPNECPDALREAALRFYADPKTHEIDDANGYYPDASFPIHDDNGDRARAALEEKP